MVAMFWMAPSQPYATSGLFGYELTHSYLPQYIIFSLSCVEWYFLSPSTRRSFSIPLSVHCYKQQLGLESSFSLLSLPHRNVFDDQFLSILPPRCLANQFPSFYDSHYPPSPPNSSSLRWTVVMAFQSGSLLSDSSFTMLREASTSL